MDRYSILIEALERLLAGIPMGTQRKTRHWYTENRLLEEIVGAIGATEEDLERARIAYGMIALLKAPRPLLTRPFLLAVALHHKEAAHREAADSSLGQRLLAPASSRPRRDALAQAAHQVLKLTDDKAPLDLLGEDKWVQAVAVIAAHADLLPPDKSSAVLRKRSAIGRRLLAEYDEAVPHFVLPPVTLRNRPPNLAAATNPA